MHLLKVSNDNNNHSKNSEDKSLPQELSRVATIGNFDGVHRGHQAIIKQVVNQSKKIRGSSMVISFEPLPEEFFCRPNVMPRLNRFSEKFQLLKSYGIDELCCLKFNRKLAQLSAQDFIEKILVDKLNIKHLIVGDDFKFGHNREGNFRYLKSHGKTFGMEVTATTTVCENDQRISSTLIRQLLQKSEFVEAEKLLGHPYFIEAHVMHGDKRGRQLGFPTANLALARKNTVLQGVYAIDTKVDISGEIRLLKGVANVGFRPTVEGKEQRAEAHFFDFDGDLYGKKMRINFLAKIRDEIKFDSLENLTQQIKQDCVQAKSFHNL